MVKVYVAGGPDVGPVVTEVKAMRGVREWVANEIQDALAYDPDGSGRARWGGDPSLCQRDVYRPSKGRLRPCTKYIGLTCASRAPRRQ